MRVAICGGSIAGLSVALALSCVGHEVHIFERESEALFGRGGGVAVLRRMLRFLEAHGHHCRPAISVPAHRRRWINQRGDLLRDELEMLPFSSWDMVYRSLSSELPQEVIHYGRTITAFSERSDGIDVQFSTGEPFRTDILVAADGTSSVLRKLLFDASEPDYANYIAWRGLVDETAFDSSSVADLTENITLYGQNGELFMTFLVPSADGSLEPGRRRFNWLWYRNQSAGSQLDDYLTDHLGHRHHRSIQPGLLTETSIKSLNLLAQACLPNQLSQLVLSTSKPFLQTISDLLSPSFAKGRVCLVGDAACTLRPHTAYGTSKAADDAVTLAETLHTPNNDVPALLSEWAATRYIAVKPLVEKGQRLAASFGLGV
jgi:2-polyprenyl-6-methoxyphenol hydroxylase-like FAD-dependent oxidoreductase